MSPKSVYSRFVFSKASLIVFAFALTAQACNRGGAQIWNEKEWIKLRTYDNSPEAFASYSFAPDGKSFVTAGLDGEIRIYSVSADAPLASWKSNQRDISATVFSPDGTKIASMGKDPLLMVWEVKSKRLLASSKDAVGRVNGISWSPDSTRILTFDSFDKMGYVWDWKNGILSITGRLGGHSDIVGNFRFSPTENQIASVSYDKSVRIWDGANYQQLAVLQEHPDRVLTMAYSPDGKYLVTGGLRTTFNGNNVILWDMKTFKPVMKLNNSRDVTRVEFLDNGILATSDGHWNHYWTIPDGKQIDTRKRLQYPLDMAVYSLDGQHAISMDYTADGKNQKMYIWERKPANSPPQ